MEQQNTAWSDFIQLLSNFVDWGNDSLWTLLVPLLLIVGIFFSFATHFAQVRLFAQSIREIAAGRKDPTDPHGITPFQAFVTGVASRVGVGNIAGVALAISQGGPGAVFWMWVTALIGMGSAFAESSLAQLFKIRDHENGRFRGGPAYYIQYGLKQRWLGIIFALALILCFGFVFNAVQANTIAAATSKAWNWTPEYVGIALCVFTLPIIFGGIRRVAHIAEAIVPIMALIYLLMALYIVFSNISLVPGVFALIFKEAFNFEAAAGGVLGAVFSQAMLLGIKRGLFSNEAGMGSAPNVAAAADVKHPASQGLIQMLGVFFDTFVVCSCTAFIILLSGPSDAQETGVNITQTAIISHVGTWGGDFLAIVIFLFAFSSIIGNYAYAESNVNFIKDNPVVMTVFRLLVVAMVYFGSVNSMPLVWNMADLSMALMAIINLVAIILLCPFVFIILKDYQQQLKQGIHVPVLSLDNYPKLQKLLGRDIW